MAENLIIKILMNVMNGKLLLNQAYTDRCVPGFFKFFHADVLVCVFVLV